MRFLLIAVFFCFTFICFQNCSNLEAPSTDTKSIGHNQELDPTPLKDVEPVKDKRVPPVVQQKANLLFEETNDLQLERSYASCSPNISTRVLVKVFKYKISHDTKDELVVIAYLPDTNRSITQEEQPLQPAVAMFHGGGHSVGNPIEYFSRLGPRLASNGIVALGFQYRLMKVHGTNRLDASKDALSAIHWIEENALKIGVDRERVMTLGMSAGGHLANLVAYLSETQDNTIADEIDRKIMKLRGSSAFYPMSKISSHQEVSLNHLTQKAINAGQVVKLKTRIHLAEFAIPPAGEDLSQPDKLNAETIEFCNNLNETGGDCVIDLTAGATHNFAETPQFMSKTLEYLQKDIFDLLGFTIDFSDDDSFADKPCLPLSSFDSKMMLYIERKKFHNYICHQFKYSQHEYCHDERFIKFMSDRLPPIQAQVYDIKYFRDGREVKVSDSDRYRMILDDSISIDRMNNKFSFVIPDKNLLGDYVYSPSNINLEALVERIKSKDGEIQFVRQGNGLLKIYVSPQSESQGRLFDEIKFSMRFVNGNLAANILREKVSIDQNDPEVTYFEFSLHDQLLQSREIYVGVGQASN